MSSKTYSDSTEPRRGNYERQPEERRRTLLGQFAASDVSARAFARQHGIKYSTFTNWVRKAEMENSPGAVSKARKLSLAEIVVEGTASLSGRGSSSSGTCLHLPGGAWLELDGNAAQAQQIAQLLKALQS